MANVEDDTDHFIALTDLPRVNARSRMSGVFAVLDASTRSGAVVWDDGQPRSYVDRARLASEFLRNVKEALSLPVGELLSRSNTSGLRNVFSAVSVPSGAPVPAAIQLDANATSDVFYRVEGAQGLVIGYLCSRDRLKRDVLAQPPQYQCNGPIKHKNRSFNRGRCIRCPFPLKG
jgi:hypothetical protein